MICLTDRTSRWRRAHIDPSELDISRLARPKNVREATGTAPINVSAWQIGHSANDDSISGVCGAL